MKRFESLGVGKMVTWGIIIAIIVGLIIVVIVVALKSSSVNQNLQYSASKMAKRSPKKTATERIRDFFGS